MDPGKVPLSVNQSTHYFSSETIRVSEAVTLEVIQQSMASDLFDLIQRNQVILLPFNGHNEEEQSV